ncbi:MAG: hypothetical protein FKY71_13855 [Spiribacter salinus]|uniref:Uncharacterized protein n=1 Tax=Spiribacter salinus TaxID=1335746 RepID=A0A540VNU2_9GAMM|nr:MAG: hypothetical protein FKY71_13855 [Spiribacter salinus]
MTVRTNNHSDPSDIDRMAASAADRVCAKYGMRDRAQSTFRAMMNEVLEEVEGAIEAQALAEAKEMERNRLRDALALPEAAGRRDLAESLALDTDTALDQIQAILARAPKEQKRGGFLDAAMRGISPNLSDDDGSDGAGIGPEEHTANMILNSR